MPIRGQDGLLVLGGVVFNTPLLNGALASGVATMAIDGTSLQGVVAVGDVFTISGEDGGPSHTVTGGPFYLIAGGSVTSVGFTPAIATGGVTNNATLTFSSNSVGEVRAWALDDVSIEMIDDTVKGDKWRTFKGGLASWRGSASAHLDGADTQQAALISEIMSGTPDGTIAALVFQADDGRIWYGAGELSQFSISSAEGSALHMITFTFQGSGQVLPDWN